MELKVVLWIRKQIQTFTDYMNLFKSNAQLTKCRNDEQTSHYQNTGALMQAGERCKHKGKHVGSQHELTNMGNLRSWEEDIGVVVEDKKRIWRRKEDRHHLKTLHLFIKLQKN